MDRVKQFIKKNLIYIIVAIIALGLGLGLGRSEGQEVDGPFADWWASEDEAYLGFQRVLVERMPVEWQTQMRALADQWEEQWGDVLPSHVHYHVIPVLQEEAYIASKLTETEGEVPDEAPDPENSVAEEQVEDDPEETSENESSPPATVSEPEDEEERLPWWLRRRN